MIVVVAGTNRQDAKTLVLASLYVNELKNRGEEVELLRLDALPPDFIFTALYENGGKNADFNLFSEKMLAAEKFVFIMPEYNGSFPGILKAFLDGLSYPSPLKGKKVLLAALSSGVMGGALALSHFTDIMHYLGAFVLPAKLRLAEVHKHLSDEGKLLHKAHITVFEEQLKMF